MSHCTLRNSFPYCCFCSSSSWRYPFMSLPSSVATAISLLIFFLQNSIFYNGFVCVLVLVHVQILFFFCVLASETNFSVIFLIIHSFSMAIKPTFSFLVFFYHWWRNIHFFLYFLLSSQDVYLHTDIQPTLFCSSVFQTTATCYLNITEYFQLCREM
jgi:hypothetical protein